MTIINSTIDINSSIEKVWNIISDLDNEPKFWKGTKESRTISKDGNVVVREIIIAFRDSKCMQKITLYPKEKIYAEFTDGILKGSKTLNLKSKENSLWLEVEWDIKMTGLAGMFTGMIKRHVKGGTEQALELIKLEAES
jgi:ribosome-associated toxin RatA of RatAB toxin-antitoxin module